jgi:hypothetical protein
MKSVSILDRKYTVNVCAPSNHRNGYDIFTLQFRPSVSLNLRIYGVSERVLAVIILLDTVLNFLITQRTKGTSSHQNPLANNCGSEKSRFWLTTTTVHLLGARLLGDGLRSLADGVFGQFSRKQQAHDRLDFAARDRRTTVVVSEA